MKIYPAVHYTMGGVWVDYNLQSTIPGCFVTGEANFSDHGANRLGASALMQGLADGYFVLPYTLSNYLADDIRTGTISTDAPEFEAAEQEVVKLNNVEFKLKDYCNCMATSVLPNLTMKEVETAIANNSFQQLLLREDNFSIFQKCTAAIQYISSIVSIC
jgi:succinate dehydrogenase/fumarate reductase flavoprotein subunit